jgi:glycosyltransferase involved in cell wall biosynthesis
MSTVSLGMTCFNRARYIASAIESVVSQSWADWDLHIVDDGSTDDSVEIAETYASHDPRVHVYRQSHHGAGHALHHAMSKGQGDYLGWVDSDDELMPNTLEVMVEMLRSRLDVGLAYSDYLAIDNDGQSRGLGRRCQIPYSADRLVVDFMVFHFRLMSRELYESVGGIDPELTAAIDYDFCLKASEVTTILHVPQVVYRYRQHADSISYADRENQARSAKLAIERAFSRRATGVALSLIHISEPTRR